jgi:hypothetical protein
VTKYEARAIYQIDYDRDYSMVADTVIEADKSPQKTGLVDQHGTPIYRVRDYVPFGFHPDKD